MVCWLLPLPGSCTILLLMEQGVVLTGGSRFHNGALGGSNAVYARVTEFWVLLLGASRVDSSSVGDYVSVAEKVGGIKLTSRG